MTEITNAANGGELNWRPGGKWRIEINEEFIPMLGFHLTVWDFLAFLVIAALVRGFLACVRSRATFRLAFGYSSETASSHGSFGAVARGIVTPPTDVLGRPPRIIARESLMADSIRRDSSLSQSPSATQQNLTFQVYFHPAL